MAKRDDSRSRPLQQASEVVAYQLVRRLSPQLRRRQGPDGCPSRIL